MLEPPQAPSLITLANGGRQTRFQLVRGWDGRDGPKGMVVGVGLAIDADHIWVEARVSGTVPLSEPDSPASSRVADLWNYDVVEVFLAGTDSYVEIELGPRGRYLVLSFSSPRVRTDSHEGIEPQVTGEVAEGGGSWTASIGLPRALLPRGFNSLNVFGHIGGALLAWHPLPGPRPDFHQPSRFPRARLRDIARVTA